MRHLKEKGERRRGARPPSRSSSAPPTRSGSPLAVAALLPSRRRRPSPPSPFSTPSAPPFLPLPAFLSDCWLGGASSASGFNKPRQIKGEGVSITGTPPFHTPFRDATAPKTPPRFSTPSGRLPSPAEGSSCYGTAQIAIDRSLPSNSGVRGYPRIPSRNVRIPPGFPQRIGHITVPILPSVTAPSSALSPNTEEVRFKFYYYHYF